MFLRFASLIWKWFQQSLQNITSPSSCVKQAIEHDTSISQNQTMSPLNGDFKDAGKRGI